MEVGKETLGWVVTCTFHKGFEVIVKSKKGKGIKAHCMKDGIVLFTQRFVFIQPSALNKRMYDRIDKYISGEWVPSRLQKKD